MEAAGSSQAVQLLSGHTPESVLPLLMRSGSRAPTWAFAALASQVRISPCARSMRIWFLYAPSRVDVSEDFPLRGFVNCGCCNHPMTANWTKGRNNHYPYYVCRNRGCEMWGKSVARGNIDEPPLLTTCRRSRLRRNAWRGWKRSCGKNGSSATAVRPKPALI